MTREGQKRAALAAIGPIFETAMQMPASTPSLGHVPPSAWTALIRTLRSLPETARQRGRRYAAGGRVGSVAAYEDHFEAIVSGTRDYDVRWSWRDGRWASRCSCPMRRDCKHTYALGSVVLGSAIAGGLVEDDPEAATVVDGERQPRRDVPEASRAPFIEQSGGRDSMNRALQTGAAPAMRSGPPRADLAAQLRGAHPWQRWQILDELMRHAPAGAAAALGPPVPEILREEDPEVLCWRLATILDERLGWLPGALLPYRDRPDLARRRAEHLLPEVERELLEWAGSRRAPSLRALRVVFDLRAAERGGPTLAVEVRVRSPRLDDRPRSLVQLEALQSQARRTPGLLTPDHLALLDTVIAARSRDTYHGDTFTGSSLQHLLERSGGQQDLVWSESLDPALGERYGIRPGDVVAWDARPADVFPTCVAVDDQPVVSFAVRLPDGRSLPLDQVLYLRSTSGEHRRTKSVVLAAGVFHPIADEPPPDVIQAFTELGAFRVPARDRAGFLSALAAAFPAVRETMRGHVRRHATQPAVALRLLENDWLQLRAFAHTAGDAWRPGERVIPPAVLYEYLPEGRWERRGALRGMGVDAIVTDGDATGTGDAEAATDEGTGTAGESDEVATPAPADGGEDAGIWLEEPDPERVTPLVEWLATTGVRPGDPDRSTSARPSSPDAHVGWWVRLTRGAAERIATAWERRPPEVRWFGNTAVARLLGGRRVATARVRVRSSGVDFFALSAEWEAETMALTDADLARLRAATTRWVKLSSGWARRDAVELLDRTAEVLADLGIEPGGGEQRVGLWQLARARAESLDELERLGIDGATVQAIHRLRERVAAFQGLPVVDVPAGFRGELRPYQRRGLDFLVHASSLGLGTILADDMGLGKTVQALAWIQHLREHEPNPGPTLVVCPASVMHNWAREAERFTPGLRVLTLASGQERHASRREIDRHDLVITNYALLRRDLDAWRQTELMAAILDEAQNVKNPDAAVSQASTELGARHRLALTGTPLENRALDLWSIMEFVNPGYLGSRRAFTLRYDRPDAPPHARGLLSAKLRPVLLRRLKSAVAPELPDRIEERRDCVLTPAQRRLYAAELEIARRSILAMAADPEGVQRHRFAILASLTRLRQVCCHPMLIGGPAAAGSGKFDALFELLEPLLAEGHKVLLFSQFVQCLELIREEMLRRGVPHHVLTGETRNRERVVEAFESGAEASVFLISLKAGGTGLNLTAASYVVLFDPWWNPAVEAQAIDRAHRIGQTRTVIAYRLLAAGTIEDKIWELQQRKATMVRDVLGEEGFAQSLDREALEYLLADV